MKQYVNFYESIKEADMRVNNTVVLYDGEPYYVLAVADHKPDGIFRVYLDPYTEEASLTFQRTSIPGVDGGYSFSERGTVLDQWLETNEGQNSGVIRKMMNSPKFNKFRPFPLGMVNTAQGYAAYLERRPTRYTQQGLMDNMIRFRTVMVGDSEQRKYTSGYNFYGADMYRVIKGIYPSADECLSRFKEDSVTNQSVAFARDFAFVRGPLGIVYLAYKEEIVGFTPTVSTEEVRLGKDFQHLRELVQELNVFNKVN